jgi:hypothetical protein
MLAPGKLSPENLGDPPKALRLERLLGHAFTSPERTPERQRKERRKNTGQTRKITL